MAKIFGEEIKELKFYNFKYGGHIRHKLNSNYSLSKLSRYKISEQSFG